MTLDYPYARSQLKPVPSHSGWPASKARRRRHAMNITHGLSVPCRSIRPPLPRSSRAVAACGGRSGTACHALQGRYAPIASAARRSHYGANAQPGSCYIANRAGAAIVPPTSTGASNFHWSIQLPMEYPGCAGSMCARTDYHRGRVPARPGISLRASKRKERRSRKSCR